MIPVVLCGGEGRRLWPLSTPEKPKPFHTFGRARSLLAEALLRCGHGLTSNRPVIVAAARNELLVRKELAALGIAADIVLEPCGRNTCAAALAGTLQAKVRDAETLVLILAADQVIEPRATFQEAVLHASAAAQAGYLVTFGVTASEASPHFGYVIPDKPLPATMCRKVGVFREKPDMVEAHELLQAGALWNSGNFLVKADVLCRLAEAHAPLIWRQVAESFALAVRIPSGILLDPAAFAAAEAVAIDVALLEKASRLAVLPVKLSFQDFGTWAAAENSHDHGGHGGQAPGSQAG